MAIGKSSSVVEQEKISIKIGEHYIIKDGEILKAIMKEKLQNISKKVKYLCKLTYY